MKASKDNRSIRDFFKPFTIPKSHIPKNDVVEDEIIVAPRRSTSPLSSSISAFTPREPSTSPSKDRHARSDSKKLNENVKPTESTPVTAMKRSSDAMEVDGVDDDPLIFKSSPSSQYRELQAVKIPSPKVARIEEMDEDGVFAKPPRPESSREPPSRGATTSFSSVSSLSSVPRSSQNSSKRIVDRGMYVVTNSDSGSAESDRSDSGDELEDPSAFMPNNKRAKLTPPDEKNVESSGEAMGTAKPKRQSKRLSDPDSKRSSAASLQRLPPSPPRTVYKHSLLNMVKQRKKEEEAEAKIKEMETAFEVAQKRREKEFEHEQAIDGGLRVATADDSDEGARMILAMQRTEATHDDQKFRYIQGMALQCENNEFPESAIISGEWHAKQPWAKLLWDERARKQACLTGFLAELATTRYVPIKVLEWMINQIMYEGDETLCEAYVGILKAQTELSKNVPLRTFGRLRAFYDTSRTVQPESDPETMLKPVSEVAISRVKYYVQVINYVICSCGMVDVGEAMVDLMLLNIDERIRRDTTLQMAVQDAIEYLANIPLVLFEIFNHTHSYFATFESRHGRPIQCRAVSSMPAQSDRSHELRRLLAFNLVMKGCNRYADFQYGDQHGEILRCLQEEPEFSISESTDYVLLNALIPVLDIAIDCGFTEAGAVPRKTGLSQLPAKVDKSLPAQEQLFNAQIDALASQLRLMSSRIRDAGTTHLLRTEAKSAIEHLTARLEYSVRTRPKPRKGVFGDITGEQRSFLDGFLKQMTSEEKNGMKVINVDTLDDGDASDGSAAVIAGAEDDQ